MAGASVCISRASRRARGRWVCFCALWLAIGGWLRVAAGDGGAAIRFAPLPMEDGEVVHEQFRGLMDYLSESVGRPVSWVAFEDYGRLLAAFRAGEIDLAYLGPLPYVILHRESPAARPLCCFREADGAPGYTCSLVALGDSGLTPEHLDGTLLGLTQPYSTCGYLATCQMLRRAGRRLQGDGIAFEYAGSHSKAALGVVAGRYDVAGVKTSIARRYAHLYLDPIAESSVFPGFAMVANTATLDEETVAALTSALLRLDPDVPGQLSARMASWGEQLRHGTGPAGECDYSAVAEVLGRMPWPIPGAAP
jgi:phosphonate transport system substrate-binding protein